MLERVGSAPAGSQHAHDQTMRVLAQAADVYRPVGGAERVLVVAGLELLLAELDHGIERQPFQTLALGLEPFRPGLLRDRNVGHREPRRGGLHGSEHPGCHRQAALRIAPRRTRSRPGCSETVSPALMRASSPNTRRSRNRAWRRFCRAWASKCEPHNRVMSLSRLWAAQPSRPGTPVEPASFLLVRSTDPSGPRNSKAAKQRKLKSGRWHEVHTRPVGDPRLTHSHCKPFCIFHGRSSKSHTRAG